MFRLRMLNTILLLLSLLFLIFTPAIAQEWQWVRDDLLLNPSGVQSFGSARIDLGDIDGDSWLDLVVLDSVGMRLYRNRGLNSLISFERRPDWEFDLKPDSSNKEIPTLADLNGDGRADLILPDRRSNSLRYWQNTGNTSSNFWTRADSFLQGIVGRDFVEIADLDNDQDLDAVTTFDSRVQLYWNIGNSVNPIWQLDSLDIFGPGFYAFPVVNIRFADYDEDGWTDIFISRDWGWNEAIVNVGRNTSNVDSLTFSFPQYATSLRESWNTTIAVGDVDKDGKIDLLTGHVTPSLFLWNSNFDPERSSFYQIGNLGFPFGHLESGIEIYDLQQNGSGEMILVHPELPTDIPSAFLSFTAFSRQNSLWLRDPDFNFFFEDYILSHPTLDRVDWDGDGVSELILGADKVVASVTQTILMYFTNGEPQPGFFSDFSPDSLFHDPALVDINDDGTLDLFLQKSGHYLFYENTGTLSDPHWEERPQWSGDLTEIEHYRADIGDLTKDGLSDIIFGETDGTLSFFRNTGTAFSPQWEHDVSAFENVRVDSFAIPTLVDLDNDSDLDLFLGDRLGRFSAFRNDVATSVSDETVNPRQLLLFHNYPNPFNASTTLEFILPKSQQVSIKVYDILAREVEILLSERRASGSHTLKWTPQDLPSGTYFIQIKTEEFVETKKAILQK